MTETVRNLDRRNPNEARIWVKAPFNAEVDIERSLLGEDAFATINGARLDVDIDMVAVALVVLRSPINDGRVAFSRTKVQLNRFDVCDSVLVPDWNL